MGIRDTLKSLFSPPSGSLHPTYVPPSPSLPNNTEEEVTSISLSDRADNSPTRKLGPIVNDGPLSSVFIGIMELAGIGDSLPLWGDGRRDAELRSLWKKESILSGAMGSMTQKMVSLGWTITGTRNLVRRYSQVLFNANDTDGWSGYISRLTQDFLSLDRGSFTELGRASRDSTRVEALWNIDGLSMLLRNDPDFPWYFMGGDNFKKVSRDDAFRIVSMPGPGFSTNGLGFSAVSRAAKSAQLLIKLYDYDADKLSNMPPQGIAAISGMTERQVMDSLLKYKTNMTQKNQLIFPGVLWLASMSGDLKVNMTPFSTLPDAFSRQEVVQIYVYTLAIDFGVDAREFWPAAIAGATRADALVQAMKAKGKGPGELISVVERALNMNVLPEGITFKFDFQDDEEDSLKAEIDHQRALTMVELYGRAAQMNPSGEGIIDRDEAREMLGRMGILPRDLMTNPEGVAGDIGGFRMDYRNGILEETDMTRTFFYNRNKNGNGHTKEPISDLPTSLLEGIHGEN